MLIRVVLLSLFTAGLAADEMTIDFEKDVRPILSDRCYACHGPDQKSRRGKLRLDLRDAALSADRKHRAIVPGDPAKSALIQKIRATDPADRMPPPDSNLTLSEDEKATLEAWIQQGATWSEHWSFIAPVRPSLPETTRPGTQLGARVKTPIDRFVFAKLQELNLEPSPEAPRESLIRRLSIELTGFPPSIEEIDAFLADRRPGAYSRLVERLLASPRYGERMVWNWLDASRYADSNGYQGDSERTMWPWRDWAIEAFNSNMPFDRFTVEQLAGDLLPNATQEQKVATGFHRNHMINGEGGRIAEENRVEYVFDQSETTATIWLGLTVGCARCHDHKFDPISQREYYQLFAFFNNTPVNGGGRSGQQEPTIPFENDESLRLRAAIELRLDAATKAAQKRETTWAKNAAESPIKTLPEELRKELSKSPKDRGNDVIDKTTKHFEKTQVAYANELRAIKQIRGELDLYRRRLPKVMVLQERGSPRESFILDRGIYNQRGDKVSAGTPAILPPLSVAKGAKTDRLALARWLVDPKHPLVARVTVNRIWRDFFGHGLVKTVADFGSQGERPSNAELLDWLAVDFRESGWNVKRLVRMIVNSATYRQSSRVGAKSLEVDPENRYLSRAPRSRWPSNVLRDQALAASDLLVGRIGGPPVNPYQPPGIWEEATFGKKRFTQDHGEKLYRRSLYTFWRRIVRPTMFFDVASRQTCTVDPQLTNTPLHALITLNETTYVETARKFAENILRQASDDRDRLVLMYRRLLSRRPDSEEVALLLRRVDALRREYAAAPGEAHRLLAVGESKSGDGLRAAEHAAWTLIASMLLNLDETLSKE